MDSLLISLQCTVGWMNEGGNEWMNDILYIQILKRNYLSGTTSKEILQKCVHLRILQYGIFFFFFFGWARDPIHAISVTWTTALTMPDPNPPQGNSWELIFKPKCKFCKNLRDLIIFLILCPCFPTKPHHTPPSPPLVFSAELKALESLHQHLTGSDACCNSPRKIIHPNLKGTWLEWLQIGFSGVKTNKQANKKSKPKQSCLFFKKILINEFASPSLTALP